jgi:methyl-branched lipid omega-hydroxylase
VDVDTTAAPTRSLDSAEVNLSDYAVWMSPDREAAFEALRRADGLTFFAEPDYVDPETGVRFLPPGPGYWAVTRHDDVRHVSRDAATFGSAPNTQIPEMPAELGEWLGSIINMDPPKHTKLRSLVNRGFTPKQVARIDETVRQQAREIVEQIAPKGECEFVSEVAAALPLQIICDMMGIPRADMPRIYELTNTVLGVGDPELVTSMEQLMACGMELFQYGLALGEERLANPKDDIVTTLMHAEVEDEDGTHRLTSSELGSFFLLLVVAGNETTRTAISHGMWAMTQHPEQKQRWLDDFDGLAPTAVEEIVRWASPVIHFRRTVREDTVLGGSEVKAGDKVVMFYNSANRDETAFPDPYRFDLSRTPNDHLGFGGGGPHFCLGANLARREIRLMFEELFRAVPDIEAAAEPDMLQSNFIHGIKRMPVRFTPTTV